MKIKGIGTAVVDLFTKTGGIALKVYPLIMGGIVSFPQYLQGEFDFGTCLSATKRAHAARRCALFVAEIRSISISPSFCAGGTKTLSLSSSYKAALFSLSGERR